MSQLVEQYIRNLVDSINKAFGDEQSLPPIYVKAEQVAPKSMGITYSIALTIGSCRAEFDEYGYLRKAEIVHVEPSALTPLNMDMRKLSSPEYGHQTGEDLAD